MEFPRLVYKSASNHAVANDAAGYDALIAAGWFGSVPEAIAGASVTVVGAAAKPAAVKVEVPDGDNAGDAEKPGEDNDDAPPTRAELEQKAHELGVTFGLRIGDAKLAERIAEAIAAQE